jgi:hypothetical protein
VAQPSAILISSGFLPSLFIPPPPSLPPPPRDAAPRASPSCSSPSTTDHGAWARHRSMRPPRAGLWRARGLAGRGARRRCPALGECGGPLFPPPVFFFPVRRRRPPAATRVLLLPLLHLFRQRIYDGVELLRYLRISHMGYRLQWIQARRQRIRLAFTNHAVATTRHCYHLFPLLRRHQVRAVDLPSSPLLRTLQSSSPSPPTIHPFLAIFECLNPLLFG